MIVSEVMERIAKMREEIIDMTDDAEWCIDEANLQGYATHHYLDGAYRLRDALEDIAGVMEAFQDEMMHVDLEEL